MPTFVQMAIEKHQVLFSSPTICPVIATAGILFCSSPFQYFKRHKCSYFPRGALRCPINSVKHYRDRSPCIFLQRQAEFPRQCLYAVVYILKLTNNLNCFIACVESRFL